MCPPRFGELLRVVEEVAEHLADARRVPGDPRFFRGVHGEGQALLLAGPAVILGGLADDRGHVTGREAHLDLPSRHARDVEQIVEQPAHVVHLAVDDLGRPRQRAVGARRQLEDIDGAAQRRQRVSELVRQHRQELVLVSLGSRSLVPRAALGGDVRQRRVPADGVPFGVAHGGAPHAVPQHGAVAADQAALRFDGLGAGGVVRPMGAEDVEIRLVHEASPVEAMGFFEGVAVERVPPPIGRDGRLVRIHHQEQRGGRLRPRLEMLEGYTERRRARSGRCVRRPVPLSSHWHPPGAGERNGSQPSPA